MRRLTSSVLIGLRATLAAATVLAAVPACAADDPTEQVQVADPYLELHTAPGRGYPVFHVAGRGESVEILSRHTDWFKVRLANGKEGWVERAQLETTLTQYGARKTFRDVLLDDYLRRRVEMGMAWGRFKNEPVLKLWAGYRLSDTLSAEATVGQVQGVFAGTDFWHVGLNAEPWSDKRLSPFVGIGLGKFKNIPNTSLVSAITTNANLAHATAGVRWHMSDRFVLRADYSIYTAYVADTRSSEYRALTAGISFFF
ncbi:SH3 domain-containing protein [Roseateles cellulosilyticus]|uniref:SH3 domain-containing protein n=1 Tax=Pelomonas cellulosilytica TaxID=2906762 RepID=A0ABS8XMF8_9BURK|nr:SH3 domain-containing protein [Pelomonas sp. P8]MCE4552920.1 SH3 domain-containing protein [Pelomonas sp. P8]